jgi:uncharacterized membrane protein (UPF0127 family)
MKRRLFALIVLAAIGGIVALAVVTKQLEAPADNRSRSVVELGDLVIPVEIARTADEWRRGLSGRQSLPADQGMLFVFPTPGMYPFWMPDMRFPIDIIWIDENRRVIGISENVPPLENASKPVYYRPPSPAQYVLEVNAGFARSHGITVGDQLSLPGIQ